MKTGLCIILLVLIMVVVSGCGTDNMIGNYRIIEMKSANEAYSKTQLETLGLAFTLDIKEGNKATLIMGNETLELTYDKEKFVSKNTLNNEQETFLYTKNGEDRIALTYNDEVMTFEKVSNK